MEENIGMVMGFTIISAALEWLGSKWEAIQEEEKEQAERKKQEEEEAEKVRIKKNPEFLYIVGGPAKRESFSSIKYFISYRED